MTSIQQRAAREGIADLYRSHVDRLRRVAFLATGSSEAAEDLVHEAYVRVHQRWHELEEPAAYLRVVTVNLCLGWQGRAARERTYERTLRAATVEPPLLDETWALLAKLPADQRVVLVLRYYEDLTTDDIAALLEVKTATVRTRIHRALSKLRKELSE